MTKILTNKSSTNIDYPICRPSLDLDFTQEVLDPRITFSRGSIGTRVNRNRLIAALGNGTLVVEAAFRSGALRTATDAQNLNRVVMAIPGQINLPLSEGCHRLIGEGAAMICTGINDALELMRS